MQRFNGFIKIHRKLVSWGWYQDHVVKDLFLHLILTANFREQQWMGRTIGKGQVVTSYKHLAEELGFTVQQIRTAMNKLKSTGEITSEATNKYTIITIENWEKYQNFDDESTSEATDKATNEQQTNNKRTTNDQQQLKKEKNIKNDKNKKKNIKKKNAAEAAPVYYQDEALNKAFADFVDFRKNMKAPMTDRAISLMIGKLDKMTADSDEKIAILEQSIVNGWKGVYPLKQEQGSKGEGKETKHPYGNNKFCNYKPSEYDFEELERLEREKRAKL